ncbi:MAG: endonuclease, partial [Pseudarthrobacter sp.]|nr:endonuclease [Pseudarthrobacter sp.]
GWTSPTGRHYPSEHHDWEPAQLPPQILDYLERRERSAATSEGGPPEDWSPEYNQFDDQPDGELDYHQLNQPLPGDYPPEETWTDEHPAEGIMPAGHHRRDDTPPDDRTLDGAWLRQALDELDPAPYLSIADFVWRAERPLANSTSS